jgi:hypothetical protein
MFMTLLHSAIFVKLRCSGFVHHIVTWGFVRHIVTLGFVWHIVTSGSIHRILMERYACHIEMSGYVGFHHNVMLVK